MTRSIRLLLLFALCLQPVRTMVAEKVADLPAPTGYVNDFAGVLTTQGKQQIEALCTQVQRQTGAEISVVTIKTLDDDATVEEFTVALEEKWKVGKKGKDNGLLILLVENPRKLRTEVGYGLEGALPDSLVGRIQEQMVALLHQNDYDGGLLLGVEDYANVIAKDAGVTLQTPAVGQPYQGYYHRQPAPRRHVGIGGIIGGVILIALLILMIATGNGGWLWVLLVMLMNGGGRGGGGGFGGDGGGDGDGGGFGGFGGGSSGGGGASSDY